MKILIIGLGSVGKRHVKIMEKICNPQFVYCPSNPATIDSHFTTEHKFIVRDTLSECIKLKPDFGIIANATSGHISVARILVEHQIPFIIEKPVANVLDHLDPLIADIDRKKLPVLVGFQMRYHPSLIKSRDIITSGQLGRPIIFHGYVGQYLPEWRPKQDYRQTTSASKKLGGGVLSDICHEIDIAYAVFGKVTSVSANLGFLSDLEIETEDVGDLNLFHNNRSRSIIHLNYLDRNYTWHSRIVGSKGTIIWDYVNGILDVRTVGDNGELAVNRESVHVTRDDLFEEQARHWLYVLSGKQKPEVTFSEGCEITKILVAAKISSMKRTHTAISELRASNGENP